MTDVAVFETLTHPPARPEAHPEDRMELLRRLRERRRELVDAFAVEACTADTGPAVSSLWPLATIQAAIEAVEAELAEGATMSRERLPARRPSETMRIEHNGARFDVTDGLFHDGRVGEVFAGGAKSGSELDGLLDDSAILISLLLQNEVEPAALARTVGRLGDGTAPASIIGAIIDRLTELQSTEAAPADQEVKRHLADRPEDLAADLVVIGLPSKRRKVATETG